VFVLGSAMAIAGPNDFGQQELRAALMERGITLNITTELNLDQPETYHISSVTSTSARVSGGDLRGLMYGLMDAADQVRRNGKLATTASEPGLAVRGVRVLPTDGDLTAPGFYGLDKWTKFMQMLARNRVNRVTLVLPVNRLEPDRIRVISQMANDHGVDFMLGIRGPLERSLYTQLRRLLDECVRVRGVQLEVGREPAEFYRTVVIPAIREAGRRVILDLHGGEARQDVLRVAIAAGIGLETTARSASGALEQPFHMTVQAQSVPAGDVSARVAGIGSAGANGFEIDLSGPNIDAYESVYESWGRLGYDNHQPTLTPGKAPAPAKAKKR
jgi:hypothetical protein